MPERVNPTHEHPRMSYLQRCGVLKSCVISGLWEFHALVGVLRISMLLLGSMISFLLNFPYPVYLSSFGRAVG